MRYWKALAFCRDHFEINQWQSVSLDTLATALCCTRRNAQLLVRRLTQEQTLDWQPGVGRGNLPRARLKKPIEDRLVTKANRLLEEGKVESALQLIPETQRDAFIASYVARYQNQAQSTHILQVPFYRATHSLDPIAINRRTEHHIASYLYATLLRYDPIRDHWHGDLAHSWYQSGDTLDVVLRKGLRFHDGCVLNAADVVAHFERLMASESGNRALFDCIDRVEILSPDRLRFVSQRMPALLPKLLADGAMGITKLSHGQLLGTGPFALAEQTERRTLLHRFADYHGYRPWIDGIEIWNVGAHAKDFALNSDVVHGVHLRGKARAGYQVCQQWERGCEYLMLNPSRHPWLKKHAHRQALQHLATCLQPPQHLLDEELAKAKGMLSQPETLTAPEPLDLEALFGPLTRPAEPLKILTYQLETHITLARMLAYALLARGIPCDWQVLSFPDFNCRLRQSQADILISGEVFGDDTEMSWLSWLMCTHSLSVCLSSRERTWLQTQIERVMNRETLAQRLRGFAQLEKKLIDKGVYQPLYHVRQELNVSDRLTTTELLANGWIDFNQVVMQ